MPVRFPLGTRRSAVFLAAAGAAVLAGLAWLRGADGGGEVCGTSPRDERAWDYFPTLVRADLWRTMSRQQREALHAEWRGLGMEFFCVEPGDGQAVTQVVYRRLKD